MSRPSSEDLFRLYVEKYKASTHVGDGDYPFSLRDYLRTFYGTKSPHWPKVKAYNNLNVFMSRVRSRKMNLCTRFYPNVPNAPSDEILFTYRSPTFVQPSGTSYVIGTVLHDPDAYIRIVNKAMDKVHDRKVNFAQFIAERQQLEHGITDVVKRLTRVIRALKKPSRKSLVEIKEALGLTRNPKKLSGNVANDWLALQYGWKPLLADVVGIAEHFAERDLERPKKFKVRVKQDIKLPARTVLGPVIGCTNAAVWQFLEGKTTAQTILEFVITNDFQRIGTTLGLTDPLTLGWELLPYSFVVDWFLPVGAFLERLNYDSGLQFLTGATTLFSCQESTVSVVGGEYHMFDGQQINMGNCPQIVDYNSLRLDRIVHLTAPRTVLPHFKDPFSPVHFANAFALMRNAFGRGPSSSNRYFSSGN
jgi:hypothetical protein